MRPFTWQDFLTLYRYRRQVLYLNSEMALTRGSPVSLSAMLTQLHPAYGIFTGVSVSGNGDPPLVGQVVYALGEHSARLSYVLPEKAACVRGFSSLLEGLTYKAVEWGAFHLLAEVEELNPAFETLRRGGFSVYALQRVWQLLPQADFAKSARHWQPANPMDEVVLRNLYHNLVPPLVQGAEPWPARRPSVLVLRQKEEVQAYVNVIYGANGIFMQPLFHPDVQNVADLLADLITAVSPQMGRPVYLAVRSYQAWLETALEQMNTRADARRALLVKHLALAQRVPATASRRALLENRQTETNAPMAQNMKSKEK